MADLLEIADELTEALALVRETRMRIEKVVASKPTLQSALSKDILQMSTALKNLSTESRLWAEVIAKVGQTATPEQRTAAALEHLATLPHGPRAKAYESLCRREQSAVQRLGLSYSP
jgi:hypothetical protein